MWIRLSKGLQDIACETQDMTLDELKDFASKGTLVKMIKGAYKAAEAVWAVAPDFKTITFETLSIEEMKIIEMAKRQEGAQA